MKRDYSRVYFKSLFSTEIMSMSCRNRFHVILLSSGCSGADRWVKVLQYMKISKVKNIWSQQTSRMTMTN